MRSLLVVVVLAALPLGTAHAQVPVHLRLPVRYPGGPPQPAPAYQGDILEIRLGPRASTAARLADPSDARRAQLGVSDVDQVAKSLGSVWFEPEFQGETPPASGSSRADFTSFYIAHLPRGLKLEDALARFRSIPGVASAQPIAIMPVAKTTPVDSLWANAYWFDQASDLDIHAPEAWDVTTGDTSIVVAIIDTGVLPYHPDLGGRVEGLSGQIWTNWAELGGVAGVDDDRNGKVDDFHGWDFVDLDTTRANRDYRDGEDGGDPDNDPNDFAAHGTAVAGLVGALTNNGIGVSGTAWKVRLMPLRIGWSYTNPDAPFGDGEVRMDFAAQAIRYATRNGANVINCSWENLYDDSLWAAVDDAVKQRITVVVAAGNDNGFNDLRGRPDVISASATNSFDQVAAFSTQSTDNDIAAPGVALASTSLVPWAAGADSVGLRRPSYQSNLYGTSFAAPLVSGAVALLDAHEKALGHRPLHPMGVLLRLWETADDISALNSTLLGTYGAGRLNLERLLTTTAVSTATPTGGSSVGAALILPGTGATHRLAFVTTNRRFVILDGGSRDTVTDVPIPASPVTGLAGANMGGERGAGLFFGSSEGEVVGLAPSGSVLPGWPQSGSDVMAGGPALGDLDGDGVLEVVCGASDGSVWAWHANGDLVAGFPRTISAGASVMGVALNDLDGAPGVEIVAATRNGIVTAVRGDGSLVPGRWPVHLAGEPTAPTITGVDGAPVIVVGVNSKVHALSATGDERAGFPAFVDGFFFGGLDIALGDVDGDGRDEAVAVTTTEAHAIELDGSGLEPTGWPRALPIADVGSPVLGQLAPGAAPELLVMRFTHLLAFSSAAESLTAFPKPGGAGWFPTLDDLDRDGATDVAAGTGPDNVFYVYSAGAGSGASLGEPWPTQHGNFARTGSRLYQGAPLPGGGTAGLAFTILGNPSKRPVVFSWSALASGVHGRQEIRIHDVMGRQVAVIDVGAGDAGLASWDGVDRGGHRVHAGVYLARFTSGAQHRDARVVLIP